MSEPVFAGNHELRIAQAKHRRLDRGIIRRSEFWMPPANPVKCFGLGGAPGVEELARFPFGDVEMGPPRQPARDSGHNLSSVCARWSASLGQEVRLTFDSTGRWAAPISADGMLPESEKTLPELCALGNVKMASCRFNRRDAGKRRGDAFHWITKLGARHSLNEGLFCRSATKPTSSRKLV